MHIPSSRHPNIQSIASRHRPLPAFSLTSNYLRRLTRRHSTSYPNPLQALQSRAFGFIATSACRHHGSHRRHRLATPARNPSSLRSCRRGGPKPNLRSQYLGRPPPARSLPSAANSVRPPRRPCRAASYARTRIPPHAPSSRRGRSAASSSWSSRVSGSTGIQRKRRRR